MLYIGIFKRIIPFVLTFAAGLFIASFFVSIAAPSFGNWRESRRSKCRDRHNLRMQVDELREEKRTLERQIEALRQTSESLDTNWEHLAPAPIPMEAPHHPPKRPKKPARPDVLQ